LNKTVYFILADGHCMSKKVQEIMVHFVISYHNEVGKLIETSTQTTILFTNCKSRSDNSKSHRVTNV
jgi:hypothetical protein